jgi:LPXTG-motif cell wall-anchored protein
MRVRRGRTVWFGLAVVAVVLGVPGSATAGEGDLADPRDVGVRLDLKTLTHTEAGDSIVYTAETYSPFSDQAAAFRWGIDRDHDEAFDLIVFIDWEGGRLAGGVKDAAGSQVATATVSRPAPTVIKISFPAEVLGGAASYRYAANADGDPDDLAPNSGLVQHRLDGRVAASTTPVTTAAPVAAPAPQPAPSAAPAPQAPPAVPPARAESAAPAAPATNLPKTGPADRALLLWAGAALMAGGALVALGVQRNRAREATGGIR